MSRLIHVVLFQFKPEISASAIGSICAKMLALQKQCVRPGTHEPYLKSVEGGRDNSPEGAQNGMTHGFVVEFHSGEDREYYLTKDPAHLRFMMDAGEVLQGATVVDFKPGVF